MYFLIKEIERNETHTIKWNKGWKANTFHEMASFVVLVAWVHGKVILKPMFQTKEKCDSLVLSRSYLWMVWKCHGIPRVRCYYFRLEPTIKNDTWMKKTSVNLMVILLKSSILQVTWSHLYLKFLLKNYEGHWKQHFERHLTVAFVTDMDQHTW